MSLERKRIFIVEDNVANMTVYAVTLKNKGAFVFQEFWNVNTINILLEKLPIDIVLLDLKLHDGVSGYDIFDQIKSNEKLKSIPILAVSATDPEIELPKTREKGFDGFISKPISVRDFPDQVLSVINGKSVWHAA